MIVKRSFLMLLAVITIFGAVAIVTYTQDDETIAPPCQIFHAQIARAPVYECPDANCQILRYVTSQESLCIRGTAPIQDGWLPIDLDPDSDRPVNGFVALADVVGGPPGSTIPPETFCDAYRVRPESAIVRSCASTSCAALGTLATDDLVCAKSYSYEFGFWIEVRDPATNVTGWIRNVARNYVYDESMNCEDSSYSLVASTSLYSCAAETCAVLGQFIPGSRVCLIGDTGEDRAWIGFDFGETPQTGYMFASLLEPTILEEQLEVPPTATPFAEVRALLQRDIEIPGTGNQAIVVLRNQENAFILARTEDDSQFLLDVPNREPVWVEADDVQVFGNLESVTVVEAGTLLVPVQQEDTQESAPTIVAQQPTATTTPTPLPTRAFEPQPTQIGPGPAIRANVTFADLFLEQIELISPQASTEVFFTLPDDWQAVDGTTLILDIEYDEATATTDIDRSRGVLSQLNVLFDGIIISTISFSSDNIGRQVLEIPIPTRLLDSPTNRFHVLQLAMDMREHCQVNSIARLSGDGRLSYFSFAYQEYLPILDLGAYPRPFYNRPFRTEIERAIIVLPDEATSVEIQAAASVAAGLGLLTNARLQLDTATVSSLTPEQSTQFNLILVGDVSAHPIMQTILNDATVPLDWNATAGFDVNGAALDFDEGVIFLAQHPDNVARAVMFVTGMTDTAIRRAGQALGGRPSNLALDGPLAVISGTQPVVRLVENDPTAQGFATTRTLEDLGVEENIVINGVGFQSVTITFDVPFGSITTSEAYIDVLFNNALILDGTRSDFSILINNTPIASQPLTNRALPSDDITLINQRRLRAAIPPDAIIPGTTNTLTFAANIIDDWGCEIPPRDSTWITISRGSLLHLPQRPFDTSSMPLVGTFPVPFNRTFNLSNIWVNLPEEPAPFELAQAIQVITQLGASLESGDGFVPIINLGELPPETDVNLYDFILIGRPTTNSLIADINNLLPQPFLPGTNELEQVLNNVSYRLLPGVEVGILQTLISPWNSERTILVITGTGEQGQINASNALFDGRFFRSQLFGNVVFASATNVSAVDTRLIRNVVDIISGAQEVALATAEPTETPVMIVTVTPTLEPGVIPTATALPSLLFTVAPEQLTPTPFPTLPPVTEEDATPVPLSQPDWVNWLIILTLGTIPVSLLFLIIRYFRSRDS